MAIAAGSLSDLGYVEEVTFGTTPATPQLTSFRRVSTTLNLSKDSYASEEITTDRQQVDMRHGTRRVGGNVETELSLQSYDMAWEGLMGGTWRTRASLVGGGTDFASLASDATTNRLVFASPTTRIASATEQYFAVSGSTDLASGTYSVVELDIKIGDRITVSGASNSAMNGTFTVVAVGATWVQVLETLSTISADTGADVTVALPGRRLSIGNIYRSYTFERAFTDIGRYQAYRGVRFNSAAVALPPTGIARVTWGLVGKDASALATASIDGTTSATGSQANHGNLTFSAANKTITAASGNLTASPLSLKVGDQLRFSSTSLAGNEGKVFTIVALSNTVATVAEAVVGGTMATYTVAKVATTAYTRPSTNPVMAAANGVLLIDGVSIGVVTALTFTADNGIGGAPVVGSNTVPALLWGNRQALTGSLTVLFEDSTLYNKFEQEQEASIIFSMADPNSAHLTFVLPRVKFSSGEIGDAAADGLPITMAFTSLRPTRTDAERSHLIIHSSL